jgi:hypothetical protein
MSDGKFTAHPSPALMGTDVRALRFKDDPFGQRAYDTVKNAPEGTVSTLPLCYYVANSRRAIVVAPFFLPRPGANIYAGNIHNRTVQMIGFETSDFHLVETVNQEIATRRNALRAKATPAGSAVTGGGLFCFHDQLADDGGRGAQAGRSRT